MRNKILAGAGIVLAIVAPVALPIFAHAQMSTTTLGANIDSVNTTTTDYFSVLLAKYWPFLVGFIILVTVWHFGKRILGAFN